MLSDLPASLRPDIQETAPEGQKPIFAPEAERGCWITESEVLFLASHKPALIVLAIMRAYQPEPSFALETIGRRCHFGRACTSNAVTELLALGFIKALAQDARPPLFALTERGKGTGSPAGSHQ